MSRHRFSFPTQIHFGAGVRDEAREYLKAQGLSRPLIVTDRALARLPVFQALLKNFSGLDLQVFSDLGGNPVKSQVYTGVRVYEEHGADSIVGVGGGAALDVAKAIALMLHHPGDLFDYEDEKPEARPFDQAIPVWIALPTTSGTGSEVGRSTVISDDATHVKRIIFSPRLLAQAVFADPELTLDLPAPVTAATGMDALTHCVESYLAKSYHPLCDGIALEGLRIAARNLVACVRTPHDIEARSAMMMASMMGAIAFQKGLGLTHSCAHALGTAVDMHHGLANGIMVDHALPYNLEAAPQRFESLAQAAGLNGAAAFIPWLSQLKRDLSIPPTLAAAGLGREKAALLADLALADSCHQSNPRACTLETFQKIFADAL